MWESEFQDLNGISRRNALACYGTVVWDWEPPQILSHHKRKAWGFLCGAQDETSKQKVEKNWDSGDIEFLVQICPEASINLWPFQLWEPIGVNVWSNISSMQMSIEGNIINPHLCTFYSEKYNSFLTCIKVQFFFPKELKYKSVRGNFLCFCSTIILSSLMILLEYVLVWLVCCMYVCVCVSVFSYMMCSFDM